MRHWLWLLLLLVSPACASPIGPAVAAAVDREPGLAVAHWGLNVAPADGGAVLYEHDADGLFTPASNLKLITAATAWRLLGPDYRFETDLLRAGRDLILQGHGDPSLSLLDLQEMVAHLPLQGLSGDVLVDDYAFDDERLGPGWAWDDIPSDYSAEIDALSLSRNVVHLSGDPLVIQPDCGYVHVTRSVGTEVDATRAMGSNDIHVVAPADAAWKLDVTVHDPALYAGTVLRSLLPLQGTVRRVHTPQDAVLVYCHHSPALPELLSWMLKTSDNLYAEQLLKTIGNGTRAAGLAQEDLPGPHRIVDGSGLSRYNDVSPRQLMTVLQQSYANSPLLQALPVAGVDGTLRNRFTQDGLQGRLFAKTGSMTGVSTLSGILVAQNGQRYAFSWMCNGYVVPDSAIERVEERIIEALDSAVQE
ncbi:MAG: D-alanyl-D-alanine carboxypeptidase/D-alanyl-D-alanine endopeptidase [Candidatus Xenobia bacterium]